MNLEYIKQEAAAIAAMSEDAEMAHATEDQLRADFIAHVAEIGTPELAEMAREVLKTDPLDFPRLCA
jgi:hypothetical protein